jgi:hypothetical protein
MVDLIGQIYFGNQPITNELLDAISKMVSNGKTTSLIKKLLRYISALIVNLEPEAFINGDFRCEINISLRFLPC